MSGWLALGRKIRKKREVSTAAGQCFLSATTVAGFVFLAVVALPGGARGQDVPAAVIGEIAGESDPVAAYGPGFHLVPGEGYRDANGRLPVSIGIRLIQLTDIDSKEETFTVEAIFYLLWSDDWGDKPLGWSEDSVDQKLKTVPFRPVPEFENGLGTRKRYSLLMGYNPAIKRIKYEERFSMTFSNELDFRKFPFDEQELAIKVIITGGRERLIDMRIHQFTHSRIDEAEWFTDKRSYSSLVEHRIIPYDIDIPSTTDDDLFPRARFNIRIVRRSGYYVWRVILPLLLITAISWAMFWMTRSGLGERLGVCMTALLTVVAYNLILGDLLPRIAYPTFVDALITMTYACLSAAVLESVIISSLETNHPDGRMARRIDNACKVLFPAAYATGLVVIGLVYL